jgi:hypothetical protein
MPRFAGSATRNREAVVMAGHLICGVCRRQRTEGSLDEAGEVFVCTSCQADAKQFLEIQQALGGSTDEPGSDAPERH